MSDCRLKYTKFNFGWGSAQTPLGELTAPQTFQLDFRGLLLRRRDREWKGRKGQKREVEGIRRERRGGGPQKLVRTQRILLMVGEKWCVGLSSDLRDLFIFVEKIENTHSVHVITKW